MADQDLKDLQYYLDHPDEIPEDPALLAQLAAQMGETSTKPGEGEQDDTATAPTATSGETKPKEGEADPATQQQAPASKGAEEQQQEGVVDPQKTGAEEAPIATKDGKHTLPYSVLKSEREKRQAAEAQVEELSQQVAQIQAQLAKGTQAGDKAAEAQAQQAMEGMTGEELEALREDFPVFGKVIDSLLSTIKGLSEQVSSLTTREETREVEVRKSVAETVQDHIDNVPVLAYLQTNDPDLFNRAVEIDNALRKDSKFGNDMATRFAKVAETMENLYGPFPVQKPTTATPEPSTKPPAANTEDARKAVQEKISQATAKPKSLSDIPSGELPESDEVQAMESMSPTEIGDKLLKMTAEQRDRFLSRM